MHFFPAYLSMLQNRSEPPGGRRSYCTILPIHLLCVAFCSSPRCHFTVKLQSDWQEARRPAPQRAHCSFSVTPQTFFPPWQIPSQRGHPHVNPCFLTQRVQTPHATKRLQSWTYLSDGHGVLRQRPPFLWHATGCIPTLLLLVTVLPQQQVERRHGNAVINCELMR